MTVNIHFPEGTTFFVPTTEDHGTVVAIVDEFLDLVETHPHSEFTNLPLRFLAWYAGTNDMGIRVGAGVADSTVYVDWLKGEDRNGRPSVW